MSKTVVLPQSDSPSVVASVSFWQAFRFWLNLGFISFGGPAGQIAMMHQELVDNRRWISEGRFLHALNFCMVLPGPEAQQLATYIGWLMHKTWGGVIAGVLFILPSLVLLIALAWIYLVWGDVAVVAGHWWVLSADGWRRRHSAKRTPTVRRVTLAEPPSLMTRRRSRPMPFSAGGAPHGC